MEAGGQGFFFSLFDNSARREAMTIVEAAENPDELLQASVEHFDANVTSLGAAGVLGYFRDEELHSGLEDVDGFDPVLFKATVLFELSHIVEDESVLPELIDDMAKFWKTADDADDERIHLMFTAGTKKSTYRPFPAMSQFITLNMVSVRSKARYDTRLLEVEEKHGFRVFIGDDEIVSEEDPVLTHELIRDLAKLYPEPIMDELDDRFPIDGTFEGIYPLIDRIIYERANGIMPLAEDLLSGYKRVNQRIESMFGPILDEEPTDEELMKRALSRLERKRDPEHRKHRREVYVIDKEAWYTVVLFTSETENNTYQRRVFNGDMYTPEPDEVSLEDRDIVIAALEKEMEEIPEALKSKNTENTIIEVFGEWQE